jgi:hypothetical protein
MGFIHGCFAGHVALHAIIVRAFRQPGNGGQGTGIGPGVAFQAFVAVIRNLL